jgi:hypothetical protein
VGLGAAALGYRGYRLSVTYARERLQGRSTGMRSGPPVAIIEHADVKRMLLTQKAYAEGALALCLYCARLVDHDDDADSAMLLGLLTPVVKTWPSEYGLAANDIAIQIHGGYGYTRDFDVEQLWRDNRLNPIHEGTTGIQAIDLLGRKMLRDQGGMAPLGSAIADTVARATSLNRLRDDAVALAGAWTQLNNTVLALRKTEPARVFDNATPFLRAFGHVVVAWLWLDQALTAASLPATSAAERAFLDGKQRAQQFFFIYELPRAGQWLSIVSRGSALAATSPPEIF